MFDRQRTQTWVRRWRDKRRRAPRKVKDRLFGSAEGDSEEKNAQRHTARGEELAARDRRFEPRGGAGSGGVM
jgi:hypothetical protein